MAPPTNDKARPAPPEPLKLQLALQGGGAKLYALVAAMSAVEKLQNGNEPILKITRIAGTSAGAIVGTLFAAGVPMADVANILFGEEGKKLVQSLRLPGALGATYNIVRGVPFWKTRGLEELIEGLLRPRNIATFDDIKRQTGIEVIVIAANLGDARTITLKGDDLVIQSLLDSAGLPFCFRTWSRKGTASVLVDGGICENLPIGDLKKDEATEGRIVAFTFPFVRAGSPSDLKSFTLALLDSAINNSMNRAKSSINETSIFEIPTNLGTFEFDRAIEQGRNEAFQLIQERTEKFLRDFGQTAENQTAIVRDIPWTETNSTIVRIMEGLGKMYQSHHANSFFKYLTCRFVVTLNAVLPRGDLHFGQPDSLVYSATFRPLGDPISCLSTAISRPRELKDYLGRSSWDVRDKDGKPLHFLSIPSRNPTDPESWELLHFLDPVIQPNHGTFKFRMEDEMYNYMAPLTEDGKDDLVFYPRRAAGHVDRIELILHVPASYSTVRMEAKAGDSRGRRMKKEELPETPYGFYTLGWVGENIEANPSFGVDIYR